MVIRYSYYQLIFWTKSRTLLGSDRAKTSGQACRSLLYSENLMA
jgi:hypothetical protein